MKGFKYSQIFLAGVTALLLLQNLCAGIPDDFFDALSGCSDDPLESLLEDEYDEMSSNFQSSLEAFADSGDTDDLDDITTAEWETLTSALGLCINDEVVGNLGWGSVSDILLDGDDMNDQAKANIISNTDDDVFESVMDKIISETSLFSSYPISCAVLRKAVVAWGDVSEWARNEFNILGDYSSCITYNNVEDISDDTAVYVIEYIFDAVNDVGVFNRLVCTSLITMAAVVYGDDPGDWSSSDFNTIGNQLSCLSPASIALLSTTVVETKASVVNLLSLEPVQAIEFIDVLQDASSYETNLLDSISNLIPYITTAQFANYEDGDLDNSEVIIICENTNNPGILAALASYVMTEEDWGSLTEFTDLDLDLAGPIAYAFTPGQLSLIGSTGIIKSEIAEFIDCSKHLNLRQKYQIVEAYDNERSDPEAAFTDTELDDLSALLAAVSYSELSDIDADDVLSSIESIQLAAGYMTPVQLSVILDKVRIAVNYDLNDAFADLGTYIASQVPYKYLLNITAIDMGLTIDDDTGLITTDENSLTTMDWSDTLAYYLYSLYKDDVSTTVALTPQAIYTLGTLARGITEDDIDDIEVSDVLSSVYAISTQAGVVSPYLASLMADSVRSAIKDLYDVSTFTLGLLSDTELAFLPSDVLFHFSLEEMDDLGDDACVNITSWMGGNANLKSITRKYKRTELVDYFLKTCIDSSTYGSDVLNNLGQLVCDIPSTKMSKIDTDDLVTNLYLFRDCCFDSDQGETFLDLIQDAIGDAEGMTSTDIYSLGTSIFYFMSEDDIYFDDDALMALTDVLRDVDEETDASKYCELDLGSSEIKTRDSLMDAIADKVFNYVLDYSMKRATSDLTCMMVKQLGAAYGSIWSSTDFSDMSDTELELCSEFFGTMEGLSDDLEEDLLGYVLENWGGIGNCSNYQLGSLGMLAKSLDSSDISEFDFTDLDLVARMASVEGWSDDQYSLYYQHFLDNNDIKESDFKAIHLKALGSFLCGIDKDDIEDINSFQYGLASNIIGNITCFDQDQLDEFRDLAADAFDDESYWDRMILHEIGTVAAGLSGELLGEVDNDAIIGITIEAIKLFDSDRLVFLSKSQIKSLTFEQASAIAPGQQEYMSTSQQEALFTVVYMNGDEYPDGALLDTITETQSGAVGLICSIMTIFISAALAKFIY